MTDRDHIPAGLEDIEARLRAERVTATALELDELKMRAMRQATRPARTYTKGIFMKSRFALLLLIVLGLMMSGTGATLAVDAIGNDGSASQRVYPQEEGAEEENGDLAGQDQGGGGGEGGDDVQPTDQVAAGESGGSLPFTGFLAIPLLLGGVALLGTGAVMRHRARDEDGS